LASGALGEEQIARLLDLEPEQARRWLKRAVDEGRIAVRGNPPVYSSKNS
jgi:transposase-like protein